MKKIIVLSDSHGNVTNMIVAVKREKPDLILHLGDCWQDAVNLKTHFPHIPMEHVPGNCDCAPEVLERLLLIEGKKVFICHGHTLNVKASYLALQMRARELEADVALFGHTHRVFYDHYNGICYLNPGSIGSPAWGVPPSYGLLMIDGDSGRIETDVFYLE